MNNNFSVNIKYVLIHVEPALQHCIVALLIYGHINIVEWEIVFLGRQKKISLRIIPFTKCCYLERPLWCVKKKGKQLLCDTKNKNA